MIVTVTPNPSVDRTLRIPSLDRGDVLRAEDHRADAGGKGVNVALALLAGGGKARAVVPSGGSEGRQLEDLLRAARLDVVAVPIGGAVRSNITLVEPDGTVTKINEPGPTLDDTELSALLMAVTDAADGASWVVSCGSLPPGSPDDLHARIVDLGHAAGARVAVDSSGTAFGAALLAGPDLVKPNREELAEATGRTVETVGDAADAAAELVARGARQVLVTLGHAGALLVSADVELFAEAPAVEARNNVGAGDAALAGFLHDSGDDPRAALQHAVAWGAAAVSTAGSRMSAANDLDPDAVRVLTDIPRATRL